MKKMNLGCGPDLKEGWINVDIYNNVDIEYWDIIQNVVPQNWKNSYDYILINHTLCLFSYSDVELALAKILKMLKPGGVIEVVDVDLLKAVNSYHNNTPEGLPGFDGSIDERFCKHLIGHGRKSIYTPNFMVETLAKAGFLNVSIEDSSINDLRPNESLIIKGVK